MKFPRILLIALPVFLFHACHPASHSAAPPISHTADTVKKNYFPVLDFIKSEIAYVDSFPLRLVEYHIRNGKTDSGFINTQRFNKLAAAFLLSDLDSSRFAERFDETSFLDQSSNLLTFTYSTKDSSYGLRRVDVLAVPDREGDKVKSIYLEVSSVKADSLVLSKMLWNAGKSFSILQIYQPKHAGAATSQTKVVWNSSD